MLCEAGLSKEELKGLVLKDMDDKVLQAIENKIKGVDFDQMIQSRVDAAMTKAIDKVVSDYVNSYFIIENLK